MDLADHELPSRGRHELAGGRIELEPSRRRRDAAAIDRVNEPEAAVDGNVELPLLASPEGARDGVGLNVTSGGGSADVASAWARTAQPPLAARVSSAGPGGAVFRCCQGSGVIGST